MATDLYLIRKNQTFAKYKQVEEVSVTSSSTYSLSGITGNATTDVITSTVGAPATGATVYFSAITGGSGIATSSLYQVRNSSGTTFQLTNPTTGSALDFTTNITAGTMVVLADDEIKVWSSEYRDLFATQGSAASGAGNTTGAEISAQFSFPGIGEGDSTLSYSANPSLTALPSASITFTPTVSVMSDEASHTPLRQSLLRRTHWKFDRGASVSPQYLYASWQDGDIIADNPPDNQ